MTCLGYARVSTRAQSEDGESLDVQQRQLEGYAQMHGLTIAHVYVERGVSGSVRLSERPEGSTLIQTLAPGDIVLCAKLDRMFRSALDALTVLQDFRARDISLHLLDLGGDVCGNGIARLVFTILSAVAESERDRIRERIADVKRDQAARGRYLGGTEPFGWRAEGGQLVEIPEEQAALARMRAMRDLGVSVRGIARQLADDGITVSRMTVSRALRRPSST